MTRSFLVLLLVGSFGPTRAMSQIQYPNPVAHVVLIVQENRTVDNLFGSNSPANQYYLPNLVSSTVGQGYQTVNGVETVFNIQAVPIPLASVPGKGDSIEAYDYDPIHNHQPWISACHAPKRTDYSNQCRMDGFNWVHSQCYPGVTGCPGLTYPSYAYVQYNDVVPYFQIAAQYGYANYFFQTNQGPSFPAHQFLFGGTSQPGIGDEPTWFVAEDMIEKGEYGCLADPSYTVALLNPANLDENIGIFPCFSHNTMADLMAAQNPQVTWTWYSPGMGGIWTAPAAISEICVESDGACTGEYFQKGETNGYVDLNPHDVLTDISNCALQQVSWVIPSGSESDHATMNDGSGPSWVASIINAIGNSSCTDKVHGKNLTYWNDTVILVTWDDWGGWYDNVAPPVPSALAPGIASSYVYGFRVPLLVVSAYTPPGTVSNTMGLDFGSMLKFTEEVFNMSGTISNDPQNEYADYYANDDLHEFFQFDSPPFPFQSIHAPIKADVFLDPTRPLEDPDND